MDPLEAYAPLMARALDLAERGGAATSPNPMVGCVVVDSDGAVLGEGYHRRAGEPHAEVEALAAAANAGHDVHGAVVVVSLEPCDHEGRTPACSLALIRADVGSVVYAVADTHNPGGGRALEAAGVPVIEGVCSAEARGLNEAWFHASEAGRPHFHLKTAQTLNGRVTLARNGEPWITGPAARAHVHRLRRRTAAVMVGVGTVVADDPRLTVRDWPPADAKDSWPEVQPLRVVLDTRLSTPLDSRLVTSVDQGPVLILCGQDADPARIHELESTGVDVTALPTSEEGIDLHAVAGELMRRGVTGVLVETGPTLATAFLQAGLVDRWSMFVAPEWVTSRSALPLLLSDRSGADFHLVDARWSVFDDDACVTGRIEIRE